MLLILLEIVLCKLVLVLLILEIVLYVTYIRNCFM